MPTLYYNARETFGLDAASIIHSRKRSKGTGNYCFDNKSQINNCAPHYIPIEMNMGKLDQIIL